MPSGGAERWIWLGLAVVVAAVGAAGLWSLRDGGAAADLPVLGTVPEFELVERSGATVRRADLDGAPWVADFVFTQCTGVCPALAARMGELGRAMRERGLAGRLVSFSVDPSRDTPEVLRTYAQRVGAEGHPWLFLTGEREALYRLIGGGFRLSVAERDPAAAADGGELITHSDRFVLVDADGRIRGYYHGLEPETLPALLGDLARLQPAAGGD